MGYFQLQQVQHCNRIGGNGLGQNLLKCRWILGFAHFLVLVIGARFCYSATVATVHFGVKNTHLGVKTANFHIKMPCFGWFFVSSFCEKRDVFRDFSPEIGKKMAKISPESGKSQLFQSDV